jgi:hypothetical protein
MIIRGISEALCDNRLRLIGTSFAFLIATAAVAEQAADGMHGHGHDELHHWYSTLRQPLTGFDCCNGQDCRPTSVRQRGAALEVLVDGEWTRVPPETIVNTLPPDARNHVCAPKGPWSPKPIFCVVLSTGL